MSKPIMLLLVGILVLSMAVAGCGTEKQTSNGETEMRTFEHFMGETKVPMKPKRVVSISSYTGHVIAAGVTPVGVMSAHLEDPYLSEHLKGVEGVGDPWDGLNFEKIVELEPDLIIGSEDQEEIYEQLEKIAPTVLIPWMEHDVEGHLKIVADVLGTPTAAQDWLDGFNQAAQEKADEIRDYIKEDETVLIFRVYPDSFSIYGDRNVGHVFYRALGLTPPSPVQMEIGEEAGYFNQKPISFEVLPEYSGDHMIVMVDNEKEAENQLRELQNTRLWKGLPAVQKDRVYTIQTDQWLAYDPVSMQGQLEDALSLFSGQ